jgi:hypothetical protein
VSVACVPTKSHAASKACDCAALVKTNPELENNYEEWAIASAGFVAKMKTALTAALEEYLRDQ